MKTVLVVEDAPHIQQLIQKNLSRAGYRVLQALTGQDALIEIETQRPDVIILDLTLPDIEGYELVRKIKKSENNRSIPIIGIRDKVQDEEVIHGGGLDALLFKPFNPMELVALVKRCLGERSDDRNRGSAWADLA